jgi:uncharacterized protein (DUF305 family)
MGFGLKVYASRLLRAAGIVGSVTGVASAQAGTPTGIHSASVTVIPRANLVAEAPFLAGSDSAMGKMMAKMKVNPTGDVDYDFVMMMVPHHQGAVEMALAELRYGDNQLLIRVSQGIIVEQRQEIVAMRRAIVEPAALGRINATSASTSEVHFISDYSVKAEAPYLAETTAAITKMMLEMTVKPSGNVDYDFAAMMIPHHQGAIDMAQAEVRYGTNRQLKLIAQEIIVDQIQEISMMRLAVGEPLPPAIYSPTQFQAGAGGPPLTIPGNPMRGMQMLPAMPSALLTK